MTPTNGQPPKGDGPFTVQFRCGFVDHRVTYTADQLRWTDTGHAWDVVAASNGQVEQSGAWTPKSGGY